MRCAKLCSPVSHTLEALHAGAWQLSAPSVRARAEYPLGASLWQFIYICSACTHAQGRSDVAGLPDTTTSAGAAAMASSSLSGLSIQQMLDLDAEALAVKIDRQHSQTKKVVLVRGRDWGGCRSRKTVREVEVGGGREGEGGKGAG